METNKSTRAERLRAVREAFDALNMEDKAAFLAEATAATVVRGIEVAGKAVADEFDHIFRERERREEEREEPTPAGSEPTTPGTPPPAPGTPPPTP
jgi:hypothetical protein